jgi:hypothetical protein
MQQMLKQSESTAARRRLVFACVDATDNKTPETGLTFAAGELKISKNGATEANPTNTATAVEIGGGLYYVELTAAEVDTLGFLTLRLNNKSGVANSAALVQVVAIDVFNATNAGLSTLNNAVLSADATADAVLDRANGIETGMTVRQALRIVAAMTAGRRTGAGTSTEVYRAAVTDAKPRVTANAVDASGNPGSMTYDLT